MIPLYDVAVIGQGVAGLAVANRALRLGYRTASFEAGGFAGGLVASVNALDPALPGWPPTGVELASELAMDNLDRGVEPVAERVSSICKTDDGHFELSTSGQALRARTVVIATGARHRLLGVPGEAEFAGRGISRCADCDGPLFRGEDVVVIGSGDSACQEALILAEFCARVILIRRNASFRARPSFAERVTAHPRIAVVDALVEAIVGDAAIRKVEVRSIADARSYAIPCAGVFPFVGLEPAYPALPVEIRRSATGHLLTDAGRQTSLAGVWAAGAVRMSFPGLLRDAVDDADATMWAIAASLGATPLTP